MIKTGLLFLLLGISMKAAISAPLFVVEKATEAQRMTVTVTCSQIPELKCVTFTCSYTVTVAMLMDAIVASPQPGTALTVLVDSATSSLSIAIRATTTITPAENARILVLKVPIASSFHVAGFSITKAVVSDKNGMSSDATIINRQTSIVEPFRAFTTPFRLYAAGGMATCRLDGKKMPDMQGQPTCGMLITRRNNSGAAHFISLR